MVSCEIKASPYIYQLLCKLLATLVLHSSVQMKQLQQRNGNGMVLAVWCHQLPSRGRRNHLKLKINASPCIV